MRVWIDSNYIIASKIPALKKSPYVICSVSSMTNASSIRFTLVDGTEVLVNKMANNKYDFELKLKNGNRKTFLWAYEMPGFFQSLKGKIDTLAIEAIERFKSLNGFAS